MESNRKNSSFGKERDEVSREPYSRRLGGEMDLSKLNLQGLIFRIHEFVSKDNKARIKKHETGEDNTQLILKEFLGHKLYSLITQTPKTYISFDKQGEFQIHSAKKPNTKTLNAYLCNALQEKFPGITQIDDGHFLNEEIAAVLGEAINKLDGIGELLFMAFWLQDFDVLGNRLDNVLVESDTSVLKIDTSEINLMHMENFKAHVFNLKTLKEFAPHNEWPFFAAIFKLLDKEQIKAGLAAIAMLKSEGLEQAMNWIANVLGIDADTAKDLKKTLSDRRVEILLAYGSENIPKPTRELRSIEQEVVVRPASDFKPTGQIMDGGNSKPPVSSKVRSDKKDRLELLFLANTIIEKVIVVLEEKIKKLSAGEKRTKLSKAVDDYGNLLNNIALLSSAKSHKRADINYIYQEFNRITKAYVESVLDALDFDNILAKVTSLLSKKDKTPKEEVEELKKSFNDIYQRLFHQTNPASQNIEIKLTQPKSHNRKL